MSEDFNSSNNTSMENSPEGDNLLPSLSNTPNLTTPYADSDININRNEPKSTIISKSNTTGDCTSYIIHGEDHTLGNILRSMLLKDKRIDLATYSVVHPSEKIVNLRLQTKRQENCDKVLSDTLENIIKMCDTLETKFIKEIGNNNKN